MSNPFHSSCSDGWHTPMEVLLRAHKALGGIDLDPASSEEANKRVNARMYWDEEQDSLSIDWAHIMLDPCNVFLNPPSKGKLPGNKSYASTYWKKLMEFRASGYLTHGIFIAFSLEQLCVAQNYVGEGEHMAEFLGCIPSQRMKYVPSKATEGRMIAAQLAKHLAKGRSPKTFKYRADSPTHSGMIVYVPGIIDMSETFIKYFSDLGCIINKGVDKEVCLP